jgi:hypothetical protein
MRTRSCSLGLVGAAVAAAVTIGWSAPVPTRFDLLSTNALIMGGTNHPLVQPDGSLEQPDQWVLDYVESIRDNHLTPTETDRHASPGEDYRLTAVHTPKELFPVAGWKTLDRSVADGAANLQRCVSAAPGCASHTFPPDPGDPPDEWGIVGYSQSATVASIEKRRLINLYRSENGEWDPATPDISFLLLSNPNRPNGGILMRFHGWRIPILGVTMNGASPTDSCDGDTCHLPTVDLVQQYDFFGGDFPTYPLNLLALANSFVAWALLHDAVPGASPQNLVYQGQYGDTDYYMIGTEIVPLLQPLARIGVPKALLLALDAPLRVLIEAGYRRDISPGVPTPAHLLPVINPIALVVNLLRSIPVGLDNAIEEVAGHRPFRTTPAGIFGVGGADGDVKGQPVGLIPLGRPDPTTSTEMPSSPGIPDTALVADTTGHRSAERVENPRAAVIAPNPGGDPAAPRDLNLEAGQTVAAAAQPEASTPKPRLSWKDWRALRAGAKADAATTGDRTTTPRPKPIITRFVDRLTGKGAKPTDKGGAATPPPAPPPQTRQRRRVSVRPPRAGSRPPDAVGTPARRPRTAPRRAHRPPTSTWPRSRRPR